MGVGKASEEKGKIEGAVSDMKLISRQQPSCYKSKKICSRF